MPEKLKDAEKQTEHHRTSKRMKTCNVLELMKDTVKLWIKDNNIRTTVHQSADLNTKLDNLTLQLADKYLCQKAQVQIER